MVYKRGKKTTNKIYNPKNMKIAELRDSKTWSAFEKAVERLKKKEADEIHFVLGEGIHCLCFTVEDDSSQELNDLVETTLKKMGSYTEYRPNNKGYNIWVFSETFSMTKTMTRNGKLRIYATNKHMQLLGMLLMNTKQLKTEQNYCKNFMKNTFIPKL